MLLHGQWLKEGNYAHSELAFSLLPPIGVSWLLDIMLKTFQAKADLVSDLLGQLGLIRSSRLVGVSCC